MKWIDVKKRLPEAGIHVLLYDPTFCYKTDKIRMGRWHEKSNIFILLDNNWDHHKTGEVTHWMELPSPPRNQQ